MVDSDRARILLEALPYIKRFHKKTIVVKYGGAAMKDPELQKRFAKDVVMLQYVGMRIVVVHGGGPQINKLLADLKIDSYFVDGQRVTDDAAMEVVEMVLCGRVNKEIVSLINLEGGRAVGISGKDGNLATGRVKTIIKKKEDGSTEELHMGRVGDVHSSDVNPDILDALYEKGYIPVIAPVAVDLNGHPLNVNADIMAGSIAGALKAEKLILLTDTPGVMKDGETITGLTPSSVHSLIDQGVIGGGMIPKVNCCLSAISDGVQRTHIIDGRVPHCLLLEILTDRGVGTLISAESES